MKHVISIFASCIALCLGLLLGTSGMTTNVLAQATDPRAQITLPGKDQSVRGTVSIQGTAMSPTFSRYELAYAAEPEVVNWISLGGSVQPVQNGQLGVWNTRPLGDGKYALRLQVVGTDGTVIESIVREINLVNAGTAPSPDASTAVTDTVDGPAVINEVQSARDTLQVIGDTIGQMPDAFVRGGRFALLALAALGVYNLLKKIGTYAIERFLRRRIDYGK